MKQDIEAELKGWVIQEALQGKYDECDQQTYLRAIETCNFKKNATVLDIGCGCGGMTKNIPGAVGSDISFELLKIAKKRSKNEYVVADSSKLPFKNNSFDYVVCFGVLHHFPDISEVAREMKRIAKKAIYIFEPNKHNPHIFLIMEPKSPFRYSKLTTNERSIDAKELIKNFPGAKISFFKPRKQVTYNFYYNHFGFVVNNIKGNFRRFLGIIVLNLVHLYQKFASEKRRVPFIFAKWQKR